VLMRENLIDNDTKKPSRKDGNEEIKNYQQTIERVNGFVSAYAVLLGPLVGLDSNWMAAYPSAYEKTRIHLVFPNLPNQTRENLLCMAMVRKEAKNRTDHLMDRNRGRQSDTGFIRKARDYFAQRDSFRNSFFYDHLTPFQREFLKKEIFAFPIPDFREREPEKPHVEDDEDSLIPRRRVPLDD